MRRSRGLAAAPGVLALAAVGPMRGRHPQAAEKADRIFVQWARLDGRPGAKPLAEALAVRGPRILRVGSDREIQRAQAKETRRRRPEGPLGLPRLQRRPPPLPGPGAQSLAELDVEEPLGGDPEAPRRVRPKHTPRASLDRGPGWGYGDFPGGAPDRRILDAVVPDRPAFLAIATATPPGATAWPWSWPASRRPPGPAERRHRARRHGRSHGPAEGSRLATSCRSTDPAAERRGAVPRAQEAPARPRRLLRPHLGPERRDSTRPSCRPAGTRAWRRAV